MANYRDQQAAKDEASARERIEAIYTNAGASLPSNLDALAQRAVALGGNYFDTVRNHATTAASSTTSTVREDVRDGTSWRDDGGAVNTQDPVKVATRPQPGDPGTTGGSTTTTPEPAAPARDFLGEAKGLYPWLTGQLLQEFVGFYAETGSGTAALGRLRQTATYERTFAGIKREDGSLRMNESEYFADKAGFSEILREYGLNPSSYEKQYVNLFKNDVRAQEFAQAAASGFQRFVEPGSNDTGLFGKFLDSFISSGAEEVALSAVRDSSEYDDVFAGNRRVDGTLRMDEPDYFAYKRGWQRTLAGYGLDPRFFEGRGRFKEAVEHEVSVQELAGRLEMKATEILGNTEQVQRFYAENYGLELSREGILGAAIDPSVERDVLQRRVSAAQIGGEAAMQGFLRSVDRAEELARAGLGQGDARKLYGQASAQLPGLSATTRRFHRGDTSIGDFEGVFALGDAAGENRLSRALQEERSSFTGRSDTRRSQDGFGLSGLRQR